MEIEDDVVNKGDEVQVDEKLARTRRNTLKESEVSVSEDELDEDPAGTRRNTQQDILTMKADKGR